MNLINQILGDQPFAVWLAGILWSFIGIMAVKLYYLKPQTKFNLTYWLNDNLLDVLKGLFWALIILRLSDYGVNLLREQTSLNLPQTPDFVIYMIIISGIIQVRLHSKRKPISESYKNHIK